jgi:DNA-binding transcriptional LysR family regulator
MEAGMQLADRIGRRLKLRELHILLAVAERGSMARAADDLAVSQPVVSKTIADLERTLGVRLLDRSRHGVEPTLYGRALLKRGIAAFDELRQGVKDIEFLAEPTAGEVRIGALAAMMAGLLPAVIGQMRPKYPGLSFYVTQLLTSPTLYDNLRSRAVDLIVGRLLRRPEDKDLQVEALFDEPLFVVSGTDSRWTRLRRMTLSDLANESWILPQPGTEVAALVADIFHTSKLDLPRTAVVCSSIEMSWSLLATGEYLAVLPLSVLRFSPQRHSIKALPVKLPKRPRPVGIVTLKHRTLNPTAQLFIDCVRHATRPLVRSR